MNADNNIARSDAEPEVDGVAYEFACDQVAAELEAEFETAQLVATLSNAELVMSHFMSTSLPAHLIPYARDLADLVRNVSGRVEEQMKTLTYSDEREAA
jgi:hypothetical protein